MIHNHGFGFIQLSERGGLSYNPLAFDPSEEYTPVVEWTAALQELKTTTATFRTDSGPLDRQDRSHVDLLPIYDGKKNESYIPCSNSDGFYAALFRTHYEDAKVLEEQSSDATIDLVEHFSSYWQTKDMPVEHVLTT